MDQSRKKLILDTSGINAFADDPERTVILPGVRSAYLVGVTETAVSEIAANSDEARRIQLLGIVERLLKFGMCVIPFHVIIESQAKAYLANRDAYAWRSVNVRFPEAEGEVVRQEIIHEVSEQTREALRQWDKDFRAIFSNAKPASRSFLRVAPVSGHRFRQSLRDFWARVARTAILPSICLSVAQALD